MSGRYRIPYAVLAGIFLLAAQPWGAETGEDDRLDFFGDWRARLETDWDSQDAGGMARADRTRLRARVRVGLRYEPRERIRFEVRLRSGSDLNHQSPHVTLVDFDDNDTGSADFNFDRWYVRGAAKDGNLWGWVGRNNLPFKSPHEFIWDADATVVGLAGGWHRRFRETGTLTVQGGRFAAPVGMRRFSGDVTTAQGAFDVHCGKGTVMTSLGVVAIDPNLTDPDALVLLDGNGTRDYTTWVFDLGARFPVRGRPLSGGIELIGNSQDYSPLDPDPVTAANFDQTNGYVIWVHWGTVQKRGDWLVGYTHASIEKLAVNASRAQDDWVRWGSADETRSSGFEGHELRYVRGLGNSQNLTLRVFLVEATTTIEDGNRVRLDYNGRF